MLKTAKTHDEFLRENQSAMQKLKTLYLGGGTPSLWDLEGALFFKEELLNQFFSLDDEIEFTMEFDPGSWTEQGYFAWKELGLNRISIGTQAFDENFIKILDRAHDLSETKKTLSYFSQKKENFSVDFLLGVPYSKEKKRNIKKELDLVLEYDPSHLSLYILKTRSNYPHKFKLPDDDYIHDEYLFVCEYLDSIGLKQYEVSNFAKPGLESKHNLQYWRQNSVAALGPNSTGFINSDGPIRYQWAPNTGKMSVEKLDIAAQNLERVYLSLRLKRSFNLKGLLMDTTQKSEQICSKWLKLGYYDEAQRHLTAKGLLMIDSLMDDLFLERLL